MSESRERREGESRGRGLGRTFVDDIKRTRFQRDYLRELKDLYYFYLDEESRTRLAAMGRIPRAFGLLGWLFKSLLLKLSPARRLLLVIALVFVFVLGNWRFAVGENWNVSADMRPWGFLILLLVLALELKDKLVAKDEIQIARQVQVALLPTEHPRIPGWSVWSCSRPANDVGGDLVDYIGLDDFRTGVLLGDVAGKGLGAALLSSKLQATLRALVPEAASLDDLGARTNTILYRDGLDNRYATLFYAELEHDSGRVRYLNAGHNPAFVFRKGGTDVLTASSFPLGMLPNADYAESSLDLEPGDMLLAYSDGLTEALNARGEEFGERRLETLLSEEPSRIPEDIGAAVIAAVDSYVGEIRPGDDLSLLIVVRN